MKAAIIGSGIGGLAAAVRLACRGHEVHVYEKNDYAGGKLSEHRQDGYRFDAGPSLFTMPQYVRELFDLAGEKMSDHFRYRRLPEICRYFWEDGTRLTAWGDREKFIRECERVFNVDARQVDRYLERSRKKYDIAGRIFLEEPIQELRTWLQYKVIRAVAAIPRMDIFRSMDDVNRSAFPGHPKLAQLFNRYATYNGSDPFRTPGMLSIIPHLEFGLGAWYPEGGMISITRSIRDLAARKGVTFHWGEEVRMIRTDLGRATGLHTDKEDISADIVLSNMDIHPTYRLLLPNVKMPTNVKKQERSSSALVFYWGVRGTYPQLDLHNILFSEDYRREFGEIRAGRISEDPTVYINITKKCSPADAPEGCENWFVLINAPYHDGQDWDRLKRETRQRVIEKIDRTLGIGLENAIETESTLDPVILEERTRSYRGSLYGTSSNSRMAAFLRHRNRNPRIRDLYHCGGSVHPGGGIPLCLLSARITDQLIQEDHG